MALPREPRQKMINIMYLVLTAILALNVSAEILEAFKTVDKSLLNSTSSINKSNEVLYKSLTDKLADPQSHEKAAYWQPKALKAQALSVTMSQYIDDLKQQLKQGAGLKEDGSFKEDNLDASTRLFETKGIGKELEQKLNEYKEAMLGVDSSIRRQFESNFAVTTEVPKGQEGKVRSFTSTYFHMTPTVAALTMLSKFQNNVKNAENQIVTYCHNQIGQVILHMDQVGILVGQSSNYLMPGQELTVTAGVGAYSSAANPRISINGSGVAVNEGQGTYKTTVSGSGEHSVSVNVVFKDENGKDVSKSETVKYTVGVPGGAAVMLDKMNVFYIGVDNPVTISSGSGWDRTTVSMNGGTLSGSGSNRIVRVTAVGPASITVTADNKSSKYDFRIKRIPDPIFKVGDGKVRMPSVSFKSQQYCRAELENFDFDTKYSIVSSTVYFSGANFPNVATAQISGNSLAAIANFIQRCGPGSVVTFDNVKVSGPDGVRVIEGKSIALY